MRILFLIFALMLETNYVVAHELTPTYPKLRPSYVDGLLVASVSMFNARQEVEYYEVGVFTLDFRPIPFATTNAILKVPYGRHQSFDVYIRKEDASRAVYLCTMSKLRSDKPSDAIVASKVCSRLDGSLP